MRKTFIMLLALLAVSFVYGQTDSLTREERLALDSMFKNDEFIKLMMGNKRRSYFDVNVSMGNGIFSLKNNSLNAGQAVTNKLFYTPSVGYYHKSGLALSVTGFMANDEGKLSMYQYSISPSYVYNNKHINIGISYTRFIEGSTSSFDISPFQNDFYGSFSYKKAWIQPGLAAGFSFGKQHDYFDTAFWFFGQVVHIRDTATIRVYGFSAILSASHKWDIYKFFAKKDAIQLQPTLMLNTGSQRWDVSHSNKLFTTKRFPRLANALKKRFSSESDSDKFKVQSFGLLANITYYYGKFYLQPQLYLDYYFPATDEKRLTALFSVTAGFML